MGDSECGGDLCWRGALGMARRVILGLFVASALLLGSACAAPLGDVAEDADAVVSEETDLVQDTPLLAEFDVQQPSNSTFNTTKGPTFAMTCVQRKQEALRTLMNFRAAETLKSSAEEFGVEDTKAVWRVKQWHERYITAASNYAFFCEQSSAENQLVAKTIHEKEGLEAQKAALRGVQDATYKRHEAEAKARAKAKEKDTKDKAAAHEQRQKEYIKLMADKARIERLRSYPQSSVNLMGFVADASTGQGLVGVNISSECPFRTYKGVTEEDDRDAKSFSKYHIAQGVTGPEGYRCYLTYSHKGYIPLQFRLLIAHVDTESVFRHAMLLPKLEAPPAYRIVMQYSNVPADIDAHLQTFSEDQKRPLDISSHRGESPDFEYTKDGNKDKFPFITMDVSQNTGYGPQTHSIHTPQVGKYGYYVKNQDHHFTSNLKFHSSAARVFVYEGNTLISRFAIRNAQGSPSKFWQVFSMTCKSGDDSDAVKCTVDPIGAFVRKMPTSPSVVSSSGR